MKKILSVSLFLIAVSAYSYASEKVYKTYTDMGEVERPAVTISEVLASRDEFNKKTIVLDGRVGKIRFKEMGNGRKFTLFWFYEDDTEKRINVYARGFVEGIENGSRIRIRGWYRKHRKYFIFKIKNTMKAEKIQIF